MHCVRVGVTGYIGSGKSIVSRIFSHLCVPVLQADAVARMLLCQNIRLKRRVIALFGSQVYAQDGTLNTSDMRARIYAEPALRKELEKWLHPLVIAYSNEWFARQTSPYAIKESALLLQTGQRSSCDYVIVVQASEQLCIRRAQHRDGLSSQHIRAILQAQHLPDYQQQADYILYNDGRCSVVEQVWKIDKILRGHASNTIPATEC